MPEAALTIGYFFNDYGGQPISRFLDSLVRVYPEAAVVNCAFPCDERVAMAARTKAYADLRRKVRGNLIYLDTDIEARKPVDIWNRWFDLGVTRSREATPLMPYNGGVLFAQDTIRAQAMLDDIEKCATVMPADFQQYLWYIDQLALAYVVKGRAGVLEFDESYNYVPRSPDDRPDEAHFIHYKGKKRKSWAR